MAVMAVVARGGAGMVVELVLETGVVVVMVVRAVARVFHSSRSLCR